MQRKARAKTCGKCIRGLLYFRCNTALGYIEQYGDLAKAYLDGSGGSQGGCLTVDRTGLEPVTPTV
jgi:hypothetical protein